MLRPKNKIGGLGGVCGGIGLVQGPTMKWAVGRARQFMNEFSRS